MTLLERVKLSNMVALNIVSDLKEWWVKTCLKTARNNSRFHTKNLLTEPEFTG